MHGKHLATSANKRFAESFPLFSHILSPFSTIIRINAKIIIIPIFIFRIENYQNCKRTCTKIYKSTFESKYIDGSRKKRKRKRRKINRRKSRFGVATRQLGIIKYSRWISAPTRDFPVSNALFYIRLIPSGFTRDPTAWRRKGRVQKISNSDRVVSPSPLLRIGETNHSFHRDFAPPFLLLEGSLHACKWDTNAEAMRTKRVHDRAARMS